MAIDWSEYELVDDDFEPAPDAAPVDESVLQPIELPPDRELFPTIHRFREIGRRLSGPDERDLVPIPESEIGREPVVPAPRPPAASAPAARTPPPRLPTNPALEQPAPRDTPLQTVRRVTGNIVGDIVSGVGGLVQRAGEGREIRHQEVLEAIEELKTGGAAQEDESRLEQFFDGPAGRFLRRQLARKRLNDAIGMREIPPAAIEAIRNQDWETAERLLNAPESVRQSVGMEQAAPALQRAGEAIGDAGRSLRTEHQIEPGSVRDYAARAAEGVGGTLLPSAAIGLLTRQPGLGAAYLFPNIFGRSYSSEREAGAPPAEASRSAATDAAIETATEALPLGILGRPGASLLSRLAKGAAAESAQEGVAEGANLAEEALVDNRDISADEASSRVLDALILGALGGGGVAALTEPMARQQRHDENTPQVPPTPRDSTAEPVQMPEPRVSAEQLQRAPQTLAPEMRAPVARVPIPNEVAPVPETVARPAPQGFVPSPEMPTPDANALQRAARQEEIDRRAHAAATSPRNARPEPSEAQKKAGNYRKSEKIPFHGMRITVENPAGSVRSGVDKGGQRWEQVLQDHYGYINRTDGRDGDQIDVFLGDRFAGGISLDDKVYVIDQEDPQTGRLDEHKVVLGADSPTEARAIYERNYAPGWDGFGGIKEFTARRFKEWLAEGRKGRVDPRKREARKAAGRAPEQETRGVTVEGVHFGRQGGLTALSGAQYGTGSPGREANRLAGAAPALRNRVHFYLRRDDGSLPSPEPEVTGRHVYSARLSGLYDANSDPDGLMAQAEAQGGDVNSTFEQLVLDHGYSGYVDRDALGGRGAAVVLDADDVPVRQLASTPFRAREVASLEREFSRTPHPTVTAEVIPSDQTEAGAWAVAQDTATQRGFSRAVQQTTIRNGEDELARRLGIPYVIREGAGAYGGGVHPNVILETADPEAATDYALAMKYVYEQDAVPWFRADPAKADDASATHGVQLTFRQPLDDAALDAIQAELMARLGEDVGFTQTDDDTLVVINFRGEDGAPFLTDDDTFVAALDAFAAGRDDVVDAVHFGADSAYLTHDDAAVEQHFRSKGRTDFPSYLQYQRTQARRAAQRFIHDRRQQAQEDPQGPADPSSLQRQDVRGADPAGTPVAEEEAGRAALTPTTRAFIASQLDLDLATTHSRAQGNQDALVAALRDIARDIGGELVDPGAKSFSTAEEKMVRKDIRAGEMTDLVRAGLKVDTPEQADAAVARLSERFSVLDEGWSTSPVGYTDRKALVKFADGQVGEVQFWEPQMHAAKFGRGEVLYTRYRSLPANTPEWQRLREEQEALYGAARAGADPAWSRIYTDQSANRARQSDSESSEPLTSASETFSSDIGSQELPGSRMNRPENRPSASRDTTAGRRSQARSISESTIDEPPSTPPIMEEDGSEINPLPLGLPRDMVKATVSAITARWRAAPNVHVVQHQSELPLSRSDRTRFAGKRLRGYVRGNEVYLVADNLASKRDVVTTLLHETVGHLGMRGLMGERFDRLLDDIWTSYGREGLAPIAQAYGLDLDTVEGRREAAEEMLAHLAETAEKPRLLERIMVAVRLWLREHGFDIRLSDTDLRLLLARARDHARGGTAPGRFSAVEPLSVRLRKLGQFIPVPARPKGPANTGRRPRVDDAARFFDAQYQDTYGRRGDPTDPEDFRRAVAQGVQEVQYQLEQERTGESWYDDDIRAALRAASEIVPELQDDFLRLYMTAVAGITSIGQRAGQNWQNATRIMEEFVRSQTLPLRKPDNNTQWGQGQTIQLRGLQALTERLGGVEPTVRWLFTAHPAREIRQMKKSLGVYKSASNIEGRADTLMPGTMLFGPKVGAFILNLNGMTETTADKWLSRTFNRHFGTLTAQPGLSKEGVADAPRNATERLVMKRWNRAIAEATGKSEQATQAILWYFEQQLYDTIGVRGAKSESFTDGARQLLAARGYTPEQIDRILTRDTPVARAAELLAGVERADDGALPADEAAAEGEQGRAALADPDLESMRRKMGGQREPLSSRLRARLDQIRTEWQQGIFDSFKAIQNAEGERPADQSAYIAARLSTGTPAQFEVLMNYGTLEWRDGMARVKEGSQSFFDFLQLVQDNLDLWLLYMAGRRAQRLQAEGREHLFSPQEIEKAVALGKQYPEFVVAANGWAQFNRDMLDFAQQSGLIDPAARALWEQSDYVPFYRISEDGVTGPRGRKGFSHQSAGIRRLEGGQEQLNDLLDNMLQNTMHLLQASMKNHALRLAVQNLEGSAALTDATAEFRPQLVPLSEVRKILVARGVDPDTLPPGTLEGVARMMAFKPPGDGDVVRVMINGRPRYYRVHDPLLLRGLTAVNQEGWGQWMEALRVPKRLLTQLVTADPGFILRNFVRDTLQAFVVSRDHMTPVLASLKGALQAARAVRRPDEAQLAILASGAGFSGSGYVTSADPEAARREARAALAAQGVDTGSILDTPRKYMHLWQRVVSVGEQANRRAVFEAAKRAGKSELEAAFEAKDFMDFSQRGDWRVVQFLAETVPFFSARLAGLNRLGRGAAENPRNFLAKGLMILFASLALFLKYRDDERYQALEDWDRNTYYHFWIGEHHFRFPKPFEVGALFSTIPERATDAWLAWVEGEEGADVARKLAENLGWVLGETFNLGTITVPVGDAGKLPVPVPQTFAPAAEAFANYDSFRERPIVGLYEQNLPPAYQYDYRTSPSMIELGKHLGLSPKKLEFLLNGYFGTIGNYLLLATDEIVRAAGDYPEPAAKRLQDWPVIRSFYRGTDMGYTRFGTEFYELANEIRDTRLALRKLQKENPAEARAFREENLPLLRGSSAAERMREHIGRYNDRMEQIQRTDALSPEEKRERIDRLNRMKQRDLRRFAEILEERTERP